MRQVSVFFFLLTAASLFAGGKQGGAAEAQMGRTASQIRREGALRVGVHFDMPRMSVRESNTGLYYGYEAEIARLLARDLLDDENKIEFVPVTNEDREKVLSDGTVDVIIATFGKTELQAENYHISPSYYIDFVGLMVRKNSGFQGLADLNRRSIGVIKGTNTLTAIDAAAVAVGVRPNFYEFVRFSEIKAALDSGLLDVFASDRTVLARYYDDNSLILPDRFAPREYGIVTKLSNSDLAAFVEQRVLQWQKEGLLDSLQEHFDL
jgi:putative glutamine transport system substrate-binding protein